MRGGGLAGSPDVARFATLVNDHLERELHSLFALAEEWH
jgi:hypothetical protein